jgi:hypothetical protein
VRWLWRRPAVLSLTGLGLLCLAAGLAFAGVSGTDVEHMQHLSGPSTGWRSDIANPSTQIAAYVGAQSVAPGDWLPVYVRSVVRYRIDVYRIGWYRGRGASLLGCLPSCDGSEDPQAQPGASLDPQTGEYRAPWHRTDTIPIGDDWPSGYYQLDVVGSDGKAFPIPFVVRGSGAPFLVVAPVNTWQAYNEWGGRSAYTDPDSAKVVSFDRPYGLDDAQLPWRLEYPLVRFLESSGYRADYVTDADVDVDPALLTRYHAVVFAGHSEYWTLRMRAGLENAIGHGTDVAVMGGNTLYWQARYADEGRRDLVEYRSASEDPDPDTKTKTVRWRDTPLDDPECSTLGIEWQGGGSESGQGHRFDYVVDSTASPWFVGTGLQTGAKLTGLVDYEWDAVQKGCPHPPKGLTVLFHHEGPSTPQPRGVYTSSFLTQNADAVTFTTRSQARVFAAGTNYFVYGIDPSGGDAKHPRDPRLVRFVRNMLNDMGKR